MPLTIYSGGAVNPNQASVSVITTYNANNAALSAIPGLLAAERAPSTAVDPAEVWVYNIDLNTVPDGEPTASLWVVKPIQNAGSVTRQWVQDR